MPRIIFPGAKGLEDATVIRVTPEMMRRLMGLPDTYKIPGLDFDTIHIKTFHDAKEILGNGVHAKVTENFIQPLVDTPVSPTRQPVDPTQVARRAPDESARIVPQRTEVFSLLPSRVRDSILLVRAAVNQGIETYRREGPRQREIGGIPEREIPTDWRARMQRDETGLSTPESIDDVKLEIAIEAEADRVGGLQIEMRKRGVELTDEVRGEIEASQKALYDQVVAPGVPDSRSHTLLFDAIARRHGGKSISELDDILGDVAPSETGGQLDLNRLHADWDTMGQPEEGIAASRDAARAMDEVESLLHGSDAPTQVARRAPEVTDPPTTRTVDDPPYDPPYPVAGGLDEILETGEVGKIITDANPAMKRLMRDKFKKLIGDEYDTSRQRSNALGYLRKKTGLSTPELNKIVYNARKALLELAEDSEPIKPGGLPGWVRPGHIEEDIYQAQTALGEILRSTVRGEKVSEGVFRRYEGILNNLTQTARITAIEGKEKLKRGYR